MADVVTTTDQRVFVRAQPGKRARCLPADAAANIRSLLAEDNGSIPHDDALTLERAAEALEDLAGVGPQQPAAVANGCGIEGAAGMAAAAAPAAAPVGDGDAGGAEAEEQQRATKEEKKKKKKRKAAEVEAAPAAADEAEDGGGEKKKKKKKQKEKQK